MENEKIIECVLVDGNIPNLNGYSYSIGALEKIAQEATDHYVKEPGTGIRGIAGEVVKAWVEDNKVKAQVKVYEGLPAAEVIRIVTDQFPGKSLNEAGFDINPSGKILERDGNKITKMKLDGFSISGRVKK